VEVPARWTSPTAVTGPAATIFLRLAKRTFTSATKDQVARASAEWETSSRHCLKYREISETTALSDGMGLARPKRSSTQPTGYVCLSVSSVIYPRQRVSEHSIRSPSSNHYVSAIGCISRRCTNVSRL